MLDYIALTIFILLAIVGVILSVIGIGGTFLVLAGAILYNLITWSMAISLEFLVLLLFLALVGEGLEWVIPAVHGKTSWHAYVGIIVGAIVGASALSFIPIIGSILGLIFGAIAGAWLFELMYTKDRNKAWRAAKNAFKSRITISMTKTLLALVQIIIFLVLIF